MDSSIATEMGNERFRWVEGVAVFDCQPDDVTGLDAKVRELAVDGNTARAVLINLHEVETLSGIGLESLMALRQVSVEHDLRVGLSGVSFFIEQLLKVLSLSEQLPELLASDEAAAIVALRETPVAVEATTTGGAGEDVGVAAELEFDFDEPEFSQLPNDTVTAPVKATEGDTVKFSREELLKLEASKAASEVEASSSSLLAVDFSDYLAPKPAPTVTEDDSLEFDLQGDLAFADTDKFSTSDVLFEASEMGDGSVSGESQPTQVLPAFPDLEEQAGGLGSLLSVDFRDFKPGVDLSSVTPVDGVAALSGDETDLEIDSSDFELEEEPRRAAGAFASSLPFPSATDDFSPVGSFSEGGGDPFAGTPPAWGAAETKVYEAPLADPFALDSASLSRSGLEDAIDSSTGDPSTADTQPLEAALPPDAGSVVVNTEARSSLESDELAVTRRFVAFDSAEFGQPGLPEEDAEEAPTAAAAEADAALEPSAAIAAEEEERFDGDGEASMLFEAPADFQAQLAAALGGFGDDEASGGGSELAGGSESAGALAAEREEIERSGLEEQRPEPEDTKRRRRSTSASFDREAIASGLSTPSPLAPSEAQVAFSKLEGPSQEALRSLLMGMELSSPLHLQVLGQLSNGRKTRGSDEVASELGVDGEVVAKVMEEMEARRLLRLNRCTRVAGDYGYCLNASPRARGGLSLLLELTRGGLSWPVL